MAAANTPPQAWRSGIARSTVTILLGSAFGLLGGLAVRVLVARTLPPAQVGTLILALGIASSVAGVATLGLGQALGRRVAERLAAGAADEACRSGASGISLALGSGTVAAFLAVLAAPLLERLFHAPHLAVSVVLLSPFIFVFPVGAAAVGVGRARGDTLGRAVLREGAGGVLRVAGVAAGVLLWADPRGAAAGYALGALLGEGAYVLFVRRRGWVTRGWPVVQDVELRRGLLPYWLMATQAQAEGWLDVVVLGTVAPVSEVALYGLARGLMRAVRLVEYAASHSFLPSATALLAQHQAEAFLRLFVRARVLVFALQWPVLALCMFAPEPVMRMLFGPAYADAGTALRLLAVAAVLSALMSVGKDQALVAAGRAMAATAVDGVALVVTTGAVVALGLSHGANGAALAVLLGSAVRAGMVTWFTWRAYSLVPLRRDFQPLLYAIVGATGGWQLVAVPAGLSPGLHVATTLAWACLGSGVCAAALWVDHRRPGTFFPAVAEAARR